MYNVTIKDQKGQLAGIPIPIIEKMLQEQSLQGNPIDISVFQKDRTFGRAQKGFTWTNSEKGLLFWDNILADKYYNDFFKEFPNSRKIFIRATEDKQQGIIELLKAYGGNNLQDFIIEQIYCSELWYIDSEGDIDYTDIEEDLIGYTEIFVNECLEIKKIYSIIFCMLGDPEDYEKIADEFFMRSDIVNSSFKDKSIIYFVNDRVIYSATLDSELGKLLIETQELYKLP